MRTPLIIGNWKMHLTVEEALHLARGVLAGLRETKPAVEVVLAPPLSWLLPVEASLGRTSRISLAAQDAFPGTTGPQTGDVSLGMLTEHITYVIVGHSERRLAGTDSHETINAKVLDALKRGIAPIVCVGEFTPIYGAKRRRGRPTKLEAASNIFMQLRRALRGVKEADLGKLVLAYEPVWAIGTDQAADPQYANDMAKKLRRSYGRIAGRRRANRLRILYGGSVKPANAAAYAAMPHLDGALVGGASLDADQFVQIVQAFA